MSQIEKDEGVGMNAQECLKSSNAKDVMEYYEALRRRGQPGERAFQLLRAHRNIVRMLDYDDEKYLRFLANRRDFALRDLVEFIGSEKALEDIERSITVVIDADSQVRFTRTRTGNWHSNAKNESIILTYCDQVMEQFAERA